MNPINIQSGKQIPCISVIDLQHDSNNPQQQQPINSNRENATDSNLQQQYLNKNINSNDIQDPQILRQIPDNQQKFEQSVSKHFHHNTEVNCNNHTDNNNYIENYNNGNISSSNDLENNNNNLYHSQINEANQDLQQQQYSQESHYKCLTDHNQYGCQDHKNKKVKYQLERNDKVRFCSKCALSYALKGEKIQEILDNEQQLRKEETDIFLQKLLDTQKGNENIMNMFEKKVNFVKEYFSHQIDKVNTIFLQAEKSLHEEKTSLVASLNNKMWGSINLIDEIKNKTKQYDNNIEKFRLDIEKNYENIIKQMDTQLFRQIIQNYQSKMAQSQQYIQSVKYQQYELQKVQENPQELEKLKLCLSNDLIHINSENKYLIETNILSDQNYMSNYPQQQQELQQNQYYQQTTDQMDSYQEALDTLITDMSDEFSQQSSHNYLKQLKEQQKQQQQMIQKNHQTINNSNNSFIHQQQQQHQLSKTQKLLKNNYNSVDNHQNNSKKLQQTSSPILSKQINSLSVSHKTCYSSQDKKLNNTANNIKQLNNNCSTQRYSFQQPQQQQQKQQSKQSPINYQKKNKNQSSPISQLIKQNLYPQNNSNNSKQAPKAQSQFIQQKAQQLFKLNNVNIINNNNKQQNKLIKKTRDLLQTEPTHFPQNKVRQILTQQNNNNINLNSNNTFRKKLCQIEEYSKNTQVGNLLRKNNKMLYNNINGGSSGSNGGNNKENINSNNIIIQ